MPNLHLFVAGVPLLARPMLLAAVQAGGTRTESLRRVLNIAVALVALVITAPLMLVVAVLVRLDSPGPVIYRQNRVGLDRRGGVKRIAGDRRRGSDLGGRIFTIYKFRTMAVAPNGDRPCWATPDDPRVTPLGRYLRATRIDELPQLVNVLLGDMNIVGPRPEQPAIFAELRSEVSNYDRRQKVLPGITGLAQVKRGYDESVDDVRHKVALDLEYIGRRSVVHDLAIMLMTIPVVVFRRVWM